MKALRILCLAATLGVGSFAHASEAPEATNVPAPVWRVGSEWEFSDGYGMRVANTTGNVTLFERTDAPGQWFSMRGFLREDAQSGTSARQTIFRTVEPEFGQSLPVDKPLTYQREYLSNGELMVHASSWTVEGRQRITVPAGTFDCWVIVWRSRSLKSDWTGFERWWYSPEAQTYVRLEYKYGPTPTASRVLMRYSLIGTAPAPVSADPNGAEATPVGVAALVPEDTN